MKNTTNTSIIPMIQSLCEREKLLRVPIRFGVVTGTGRDLFTDESGRVNLGSLPSEMTYVYLDGGTVLLTNGLVSGTLAGENIKLILPSPLVNLMR